MSLQWASHRRQMATNRRRDGAVPLYEFEITGTIGPLIQSCLPGLSTIAETRWTVLTGTVPGPDELHRVLDLLHAQGTPALDIRISGSHGEAAASLEHGQHH